MMGLRYYPLHPDKMATTCRALACDLRAEHAMGHESISLAKDPVAGGPPVTITRAEAAASLEEQARRWEAEARGEARNVTDRAKIGVP